MNIHENIKKLRERRDETLQDVAKAIGSSKQTIQRYETGEIKNIPYDNVLLLAKHFNVAPGFLMGWENSDSIVMDDDNDVIEHIELISKWERLSAEKQKAVMDIIDALNGEGE